MPGILKNYSMEHSVTVADKLAFQLVHQWFKSWSVALSGE